MKFQNKEVENIHSWPLFLIMILSLLILFFSNPKGWSLAIYMFSVVLLLINGLKLNDLLKNCFYSLLFSFTFFLLYLIYPAPELKTGESLQIGPVIFYVKVLTTGLENVLRLFLLTSLSVSSLQGLSYTKIMLYLSSSKLMSVQMAYPILMALHSIELLKEEFMRIRLSLKMRGLSRWRQIFILFPLLVFAIRHAERGSLSLVTRGINPDKKYYFDYSVKKKDWMILLCSLLFMVLVLAIEIIFR